MTSDKVWWLGRMVHHPVPLGLRKDLQKLIGFRNCLLIDEPIKKAILTWSHHEYSSRWKWNKGGRIRLKWLFQRCLALFVVPIVLVFFSIPDVSSHPPSAAVVIAFDTNLFRGQHIVPSSWLQFLCSLRSLQFSS